MSDFVFIIPPEWTKLDLAQVTQVMALGIIRNWIYEANYVVMASELASVGILKDTDIILEAQLFGEDIFIVKLLVA